MDRLAPLPPHRIALRALVHGAAGAVVVGLFLTCVLLVEAGPDREAAAISALLTLLAGVWCALLSASVEASCHVPWPALRYLAPLAVGLTLLLSLSAVVVWAVSLVEGRGMAEALDELLRLWARMRREPRASLAITITLTIPFACLAWLRLSTRVRPPGAPGSLAAALETPPAQAALAAASGLLGLLALCLTVASAPPGLGLAVLLSAGVPACTALALRAGDLLEELLLAAWRRRLVA